MYFLLFFLSVTGEPRLMKTQSKPFLNWCCRDIDTDEFFAIFGFDVI